MWNSLFCNIVDKSELRGATSNFLPKSKKPVL
nr:MAG TPA: hypothetical protein [Caudoviricetes sp.]DAZ73966.1 MAG TPA: hypothetical protein [Caudoviricetes sp.]